MPDITKELQILKEYKPLWEKFFDDQLDAILDDKPFDREGIDPRVKEYILVEKHIKDIILKNDSYVISDPTLHRLYHELRRDALELNYYEDGSLHEDSFWQIVDELEPHVIAENIAATKPLISLIPIPIRVEKLISEMRKAYCLGLATASISLSRSIVECVIIDIAVRADRVNPDQIMTMGMCDRISALIDKSVSRSSPLRRDINSFMEATSNVIHSNQTADMPLALSLYQDSIKLIQSLYGQYKAQLKK